MEGLGDFRAKESASNPLRKKSLHVLSEYCLILIPNSSLLEKQTPAQTKVANPTPPFLFLFYNTPIYPVNLSEVLTIIIVIIIKIRPTFMQVLYLFLGGVCISLGTAFIGLKKGCPIMVGLL